MTTDSVCLYGKKEVTLDALIVALEEAQLTQPCKLLPYGQNESALLDAIAQLKGALALFDGVVRAVVDEGEQDAALLSRLKSNDEVAYLAIVTLGQVLICTRSERDDIQRETRRLADALADINNAIGEDAVVRSAFAGVSKLVESYKG